MSCSGLNMCNFAISHAKIRILFAIYLYNWKNLSNFATLYINNIVLDMKPVKILSVDDEMDLELLLTQYFRRKIRKGEYEFFFAHNGLEALTVLLKEKDINIILSDINMPEMDGLTVCSPRLTRCRTPP